jgi:hypothetical protein
LKEYWKRLVLLILLLPGLLAVNRVLDYLCT